MPKKQIRTAAEFNNLGTIHNRATADIGLIDEEKRLIPFILVSKDNAGLRYDWWNDEVYEERLQVTGATFERLKTFFKDHIVSVDNAIGKVEDVRIEDGEIKANVIFGTDEVSNTIYTKFREGILSDVSIGYSIQEVVTTERENEPTEVLVTRFDIHEASAVWMGFDKNATIGRSKENLDEEVTLDEIDSDILLKETRSRSIDLIEMS